MTYPPPSSTQPVLQSGDYYRLLTTLASPGDVYDSEESGYGVAIGPLSDIARVNVAYFDDTAPSKMRIVQVTNKAPLIGRINARPVVNYGMPDFPPAGANSLAGTPPEVPPRGRVLFSLADNVPQFNVAGSNSTMFTVGTQPIVLDLIQYFQPPAVLPTLRNDKKYYFDRVPTSGITNYTINLPFFGRAWGQIAVSGSATQQVAIFGLRFGIGNPVAPVLWTIRANAAIGANGFTTIIDTNVLGEFDFIQIVYAAGDTGIAPTNVIFSDIPR